VALVLIALGIVPAAIEELCFRGFLFGALRTILSGTWTVIASAALFGVFHEVLFPGRLLTSAFLGLVLGWVRLRTGSVIPGIVLHALHNCFVLLIAYYRDALIARDWGVEDQTHFPIAWLAAALLGVLVGVGLLLATTRQSEKRVSETA